MKIVKISMTKFIKDCEKIFDKSIIIDVIYI